MTEYRNVRDQLNDKKTNMYDEIRSDDNARAMVDEADVFAKEVSPEHFDATMRDALDKHEDALAAVFQKSRRLLLKHLLPRMKRCFNGGKILMPYFAFALDAGTFECYMCMLTPAVKSDICFSLRLYQVEFENCFVCKCDKETALHVFASDLQLSARHGVQPSLPAAAAVASSSSSSSSSSSTTPHLHFERAQDDHVKQYREFLVREANMFKRAVAAKGLTLCSVFEPPPAAAAVKKEEDAKK
jgi:hypothetical protein